MNEIIMQQAIYKGDKGMGLRDVPTAKATGFNAAADDYMERGIDLNEQLITNKLATYFFRMTGDAMISAGIKHGDILIVDRSLTAISGKIIVALFDDELVVCRMQKNGDTVALPAENKTHVSATVNEPHSYTVWGVVTYVISVV